MNHRKPERSNDEKIGLKPSMEPWEMELEYKRRKYGSWKERDIIIDHTCDEISILMFILVTFGFWLVISAKRDTSKSIIHKYTFKYIDPLFAGGVFSLYRYDHHNRIE